MTPTAVTATPAGSVSASTAAPEASPGRADFLATLLLTIGLGTGTSQSEADTVNQATDDDEPASPAPTTDLTTLGTTASVALAAMMPMTTPVPLPQPPPEPVVESPAAAANEAAPIIAGGTAPEMTVSEMSAASTVDAPEIPSSPRAARPEHASTTEAAAVAPDAHHALTELGAATTDASTDATRTAMIEAAAESAKAPRPAIEATTGQTVSKNDPREAEAAASTSAPTTAAKPATAAAAAATAKPEMTASSAKTETAERHPAPATKAEPMPHGGDVVALHAHADVTPRAVTVDGPASVSTVPAPASVVEPQVVAEQVVRAARLVVSDGLAQMRVDLEPPTLGGVRVQADIRGEVVILTITAERPETQALLTQALPDIQQALGRRDVGPTSVAIIGATATPLSSDGRRAPERRPETPRERPTSPPAERRRTLRASRAISAVDITV